MGIVYTPINNFAAKDTLISGNPSKLILGAQISAELAAIQTALAGATVSGTFTGTLTGCATAPTAVLNYTIVNGVLATVYGPTGALNALPTAPSGIIGLSGLPGSLTPASGTVALPTWVLLNGAFVMGTAFMQSLNISLAVGATGTFAGAATGGFGSFFSVTYSLV